MTTDQRRKVVEGLSTLAMLVEATSAGTVAWHRGKRGEIEGEGEIGSVSLQRNKVSVAWEDRQFGKATWNAKSDAELAQGIETLLEVVGHKLDPASASSAA